MGSVFLMTNVTIAERVVDRVERRVMDVHVHRDVLLSAGRRPRARRRADGERH
jgi:hypothetical protein